MILATAIIGLMLSSVTGAFRLGKSIADYIAKNNPNSRIAKRRAVKTKK